MMGIHVSASQPILSNERAFSTYKRQVVVSHEAVQQGLCALNKIYPLHSALEISRQQRDYFRFSCKCTHSVFCHKCRCQKSTSLWFSVRR